MLYIYKDGNGDYNAICDGRMFNKPTYKLRKDRYGSESEYAYFDVVYNYDKQVKQSRIIRCIVTSLPAVRNLRFIHKNDKILLFGTIVIDKRRSQTLNEKRYNLIVSSFLNINELYGLIEKAHVNDNFEAKIMSQYKRQQRNANEINLLGEAEKIISQNDVLL